MILPYFTLRTGAFPVINLGSGRPLMSQLSASKRPSSAWQNGQESVVKVELLPVFDHVLVQKVSQRRVFHHVLSWSGHVIDMHIIFSDMFIHLPRFPRRPRGNHAGRATKIPPCRFFFTWHFTTQAPPPITEMPAPAQRSTHRPPDALRVSHRAAEHQHLRVVAASMVMLRTEAKYTCPAGVETMR